jgi:hypothetical protein
MVPLIAFICVLKPVPTVRQWKKICNGKNIRFISCKCLIFHTNFHSTTVSESESVPVSEAELFFGFGFSQNIRIISDLDPQHFYYRRNEKSDQPVSVLWIRIRKNPWVLAGSESENTFGYGFGSRHCCRMKIFVNNRRSNTWKRKILCFSIEKIFSLTYGTQVPEHKWKQLEAPLRKIWGQNISL